MKFRHKFDEISRTDSVIAYQCGDINAEIKFISDKCINVNIIKSGAEKSIHSIDKGKYSYPLFSLRDIEIKVDTNNFIISYYKDGKRLFSDRAPLAYNLQNEFGNGSFHYISREKNEKIYGLGDKAGFLNKAGNSYKIETTDTMGYAADKSDPLYKHVAFYICENSVGCYGIYYDTSCTSYIDLGREHNNYYEPYKYFQSDDGELDYYVFFGSKLEILQEFGRLIGRQAFPPRWSFDYCGSTMAYTDAPNAYEEMLGFIEKLKEYDLSCRGFYLSSGYTSIGNQRCVFNWNYDKFPDPEEFVRVYKENGIELIPNIKPSFLVTHPMYEKLEKEGLFVKNPDGTPFVTQLWDNLGSYLDFTNPRAFDFWKRQVKEKLLDLGITATWNDNNEFDIRDTEAEVFTGEKAHTLRPHLTYLMDKASYEAQTEKRPDLRPFLSTRSGGARVRTLAQTWSGDNFTSFKDLKFCHFIGLTMSLSGFFFYGHDLGGFSGEMPSRELLMRWLQHGLFEPRFTIHSWNEDGSATMPWSYPDIMDSVRAVFEQRKQLIPYLYNCAYRAVTQEIPINAPLFLYYDDKKLDENSSEFMLGRDILVSCVLDEGIDSLYVYLPKGDDWYLDSTLYSGGSTVNLNIPAFGKMPYFVRAGSVIPTDEAPYGFKSKEELTLTVYPLKSGKYESGFFWDDGESFDWEKGECALLKLSVECKEDTVEVSIKNNGKTEISPVIRLCKGDERKLVVNKF